MGGARSKTIRHVIGSSVDFMQRLGKLEDLIDAISFSFESFFITSVTKITNEMYHIYPFLFFP